MKTIAKRLLLAAAIGLPLWMLTGQFHEVAAAAAGANPLAIAGVLLGLIAYTAFNASVWSDVLAGLGGSPGRRATTRMWIQCEIMKWLPGGVWGYASRVVKAPAIGIDRTKAGASLVIELLLTIAAWATLAAAGLLADGKLLAKLTGLAGGTALPPWIGLLAPLPLLALLLAPVRRAVTARFSPLRGMSWQPAALARAFVSYLILCAAHAGLLLLLVHAVSQGGIGWSQAAAADGSAWLIGFFAIGVPGGIGVREAGIAWFLGVHLPMPEAMAVAVLWRVLQIAAELLTLGASHLSTSRSRSGCLDTATPATLDQCG